MAPLVRLVLSSRRAARLVAPLGLAAALAVLVVLDAAKPLAVAYVVGAGLIGVAVLAAVLRRRVRATESSRLLDLHVAALAMVLSFGAASRASDSLDGTAYPLVFVCLALVSAFARPTAAILTVFIAMVLEVAIRMLGYGEPSPVEALPHLGFMVVFALLNATVLRGEIARLRGASEQRIDEEINRLRDDARSYRLLGAPSTGKNMSARRADADRLARSGVEEIHQAVLLALRLLRESLNLHTAMLLWKNDAGTHLRISELASDSPDLCEGPFLIGDGVLGAALSRRAAVSLAGLKSSYQLPYYLGECPVRSVCVLPVFEHGQLRGALVVDRVEDRPFSPREEQLVEEAGRYAVRAIHNERVFFQLERAKVEQGMLYRAAEALAASCSESDVIDAGVHSAREITSVDFAAVTLFDETTDLHEIRAVSGDGAEELMGQRFRHNAGLVSMVLENRHPLPYRGEYDESRQMVFTKRLAPPSMPSLMVLPLLVRERPLGTLVLGSTRPSVFHEATRNTLEVLASHMAVSLESARMMQKLEELATMDGLTGLLNKRAMLDVADQKLRAAKRFDRQLSVLIVDIDHFKRVNDTWGHDVGDVVIKGLGGILQRAKRDTDSVARFGGEEFVIICEETDERGAMLLAERIRTELERTTFFTTTDERLAESSETLQVTGSIGLATFPMAGGTWDEMFKAADTALYVSKRSGRNRCTAHAPGRRATTAA